MDKEDNRPPVREFSEAIQNDLLVRALNFHGQQLTSLIKDEAIFRELELKNVDYHLYQTRCPELRMEDRGYRLDLHRFIATNMIKIFKENQKACSNVKLTEPVDGKCTTNNQGAQVKDENSEWNQKKDTQHLLSANMPPYEMFASKLIDKEDRLRHVFEVISVSDVIYCRVAALNASGLLLNVCCFASINLDVSTADGIVSKSRYMDDLKIKCFCPADEMVGASENQTIDKGRLRSYQTGDYVCVVVLEVKRDVQRLLVGMKCNTLPNPVIAGKTCMIHGIRLGLVPGGVSSLPHLYKKALQATEKNLRYDNLLEKSEGFGNPTNVDALANDLGLSNFAGEATIMSNLGPYPSHSFAKQLRKRQNANASFHHVAKGVKHFKAGENSEAFQCLNAALRIDQENVEGFVARGALYANNGSLLKAIEDFEAALNIKRNHRNAQKYLQETLMAVTQNYENDKSFFLARETYTKILALDPESIEARERLCQMLITYGKQLERDHHIEEAVTVYINAMAIDQGNKEAKCSLLSIKMRYKGTSMDHTILQRMKR